MASGFELSKVLVLAREGDELDKLQSLLQQHLPHSDAHLVRGNFFFEILHPAVNKGAGLRGLCEKLQIPLSEVVAMGDGDNDAEFLAVAGQGIAMINGTPMAKRAASRISERSNHENGVAHELRRVFASIL
jgi:hydroxymethylpyrimidine pyrophosphatase-like HAD family hydrolase